MSLNASSEGYVKYTVEHKMAEAIEVPNWKELNDARTHLHHLGLVGALSNGIGFGNLSLRSKGNEFLISGTSTGASPVLGSEGYCLVRSFDLKQNRVISMGPVQPSAESMTHGAVYSSSGANCVIHIHSRTIFDGMVRDKYPATPKDADYGTPEIALAVEKCVQELGGDEGQIVLLGHDEGAVIYAPTVERTLMLVQELYDKYSILV